jgi:glucose/arabinose dehydrogenase
MKAHNTILSLIVGMGCGGSSSTVDSQPKPIDARPDAPPAACTAKPGSTIATELVVDNLQGAVLVTAPVGDTRLFVVEQPGTIQIVKGNAVNATPFLDVSSLLVIGGINSEQGLLGMAFHPDFASNGKFYVHYSKDGTGATVIAEYKALGGTDVADPASAKIILEVPQPFSNHNGGAIEFGRDGFLYIALGDGGDGGDPGNRAQNDAVLLGKMLRIDVNTTTGNKKYGIPADNPFAASADGPADPRPEIWHKGLRNPFRFSFDSSNGDIYIADVGQGLYEELDAGPNSPGTNWGWKPREGKHCFSPMTGCATAGLTDPVTEHTHDAGWRSIIGGHVYRGTCFPDLVGQFFYTDYFINQIWSFTLSAGAATGDKSVVQSNDLTNITSIHADGFGEMYLTRASANGSSLRRIVVQ